MCHRAKTAWLSDRVVLLTSEVVTAKQWSLDPGRHGSHVVLWRACVCIYSTWRQLLNAGSTASLYHDTSTSNQSRQQRRRRLSNCTAFDRRPSRPHRTWLTLCWCVGTNIFHEMWQNGSFMGQMGHSSHAVSPISSPWLGYIGLNNYAPSPCCTRQTYHYITRSLYNSKLVVLHAITLRHGISTGAVPTGARRGRALRWNLCPMWPP